MLWFTKIRIQQLILHVGDFANAYWRLWNSVYRKSIDICFPLPLHRGPPLSDITSSSFVVVVVPDNGVSMDWSRRSVTRHGTSILTRSHGSRHETGLFHRFLWLFCTIVASMTYTGFYRNGTVPKGSGVFGIYIRQQMISFCSLLSDSVSNPY